MSRRKQFIVWTWYDSFGQPRYVGWGAVRGQTHPADNVWRNRDSYESDLNAWLRHLAYPPMRDPGGMAVLFYHDDARSIAENLRKRYQADTPLLDARSHDTRMGGGKGRRVLSPNWDLYGSVREAAEALEVAPSTITRRCQSPHSDWSYI